MAKWEYLSYSGDSYGTIIIGKDNREALAQYLRGALPTAQFKVGGRASNEIIEVRGGARVDVFDALGQQGWEYVGDSWFKRPIGG